MESTSIRGVYFFPDRDLYRAKVHYKNKAYHLGYFEDKEKAELAYKTAKENAKKGITPERAVIRTDENGKRIYRARKPKNKSTGTSETSEKTSSSE